jgi:hypothetical protein
VCFCGTQRGAIDPIDIRPALVRGISKDLECNTNVYDLFRCNIIKDSRFVCGYIREDTSHFLLNCHLYIEQRTVLFHFLHHHNFRRDIRTLLFGDSQKDLAQNVLCSIYKWQFKRKWEVSSLIYPQTNLESFIILHRKRSYFSELQLLRNLEYKILDILSPTKKWPGIFGSFL